MRNDLWYQRLMSKARSVTVSSGAANALRRGHPWIWRDGVTRGGEGLETGAVIEVRASEGEPLGQGLWDAASPIAARLYTPDLAPRLAPETIVASVARAVERRVSFRESSATTAYRMCNGEGDRVPGVVIDRYDDVGVLRLDGDAVATWLGEIGPLLGELLARHGVRSIGVRRDRRGSDTKLEPLFGASPPDSITVRENGVSMVVDLAHGQKTGAFLDQRDNRARVRELAANRRVLNLFSYAGGFSTAAVLGGARQVTSVDLAQAAHRAAELSMRANGIDPGVHVFVTSDAFVFLASAKSKGHAWDLVVSDPPSFAPSEKAKPRALAAYRKLHGACASVLAPGGILCAASCSSHVTAEDFASTLDDAALGRADLSVVGLFGPPADHPTLASFPEGRYLKFAVLR